MKREREADALRPDECLVRAIAKLRHAYQQLVRGDVKNQDAFARGLLGPAIEELERLALSAGVTPPRAPEPPAHIVELAIEVSGWSPCRSKRGVVVFNGDDVLAHGHNRKPRGFDCDSSSECKSTCRDEAIHAEQDALLTAGTKARGADMLHVKTVDGVLVASGGPSCVQCSKLALAASIAGVWLYHEHGWQRYETAEFHRLSLAAARPLAPSGPQQQQNGEWPPFRDDGKTLNRPHEFDKDPETGFCVICGWSDSVHFPLAPSGTPAEEDAAGALDNYIAGLLKRAESAEAVHAALRDECRRWRAAMAYLMGDVADAGTPEECRAAWDRQQGDARDAELRLAVLRARLEKLADKWRDPEYWNTDGARMDSVDCAAVLLAALREEQETTT